MRNLIRKPNRLIVLSGILLLAASSVAQTQRLTVSQAVAIALEKSPSHKIALADQVAAGAGVKEAQTAYLPHIAFSESAMAGNDPVFAFGTRLRQGRFTANDFALNSLNYPDTIGDFNTKVGGQWTLFDSFSTKLQVERAGLMKKSADLQLTRSDQELVYRVVDSYYALMFAAKQAELAGQTVKTAEALVASSRARVESGMAVDSDLLSAQVNLASRQQELIRARSAVSLARTQLETVLGTPLPPDVQLVEALKDKAWPAVVLSDAEQQAQKQRADLQQVSTQVSAQQTGVKLAKAAFGPQVNVFGSWQRDNVSLFANGNSNWVAGAELKIDLFPSDKLARLQRERAMLTRAEAYRQSAQDNVRLDVRRAYYEYDAARQMLDVARSSVSQSEESLRIVKNRYDSGLTTITDMLRAEDAERASRNNYWQSVYQYAVSFAALQLATGDLNSQSPVVQQ